MIDYRYAELFKKDSTDKQISITFDGGRITNEELYSGSFELEESLCSGSVLRFGSCEASRVKFKTTGISQILTGKELTITMTLDGYTDTPFMLGRYKVLSDRPTADRKHREIVAYDAMHDIINAEVSDWYNDLLPHQGSAVTLQRFRNSFISHFGIKEKAVSLVNDGMVVRRTILPSELSGKDVITAICELNGCFGHIGRDGMFSYVTLPGYTSGVYPAIDLYPADSFFTGQSGTTQIERSYYTSCQYEDYIVQGITKLQIRQEENDIGAIAGSDGNCYIVEDNFLVYGMGAAELGVAARNLYSVIAGISYRPFEAACLGTPCFEVGDPVRLATKYDTVESYILQRTLKGIQALRDTFEAEGEEVYSEEVNSVNRSIVQLKGKTNTLERNVAEMRSTITDTENSLQSQIAQTSEAITTEVNRAKVAESSLSGEIASATTELSSKMEQTAESITSTVEKNYETKDHASSNYENLSSSIAQTAERIELKVSKGELSSEISLENGDVTFRGNRVSIESDNFNLTKEGEVSATGRFSSKTVNAGIAYESVVGDAGLRVIANGLEIGRVTSGTALGIRGIGIGSDNIVTINGGGQVGYMLNPSGTAGGYGERNIFSGETRFLGKVNVGSKGGISTGTYTISDNEIRSTTGIHLIPNNGTNNVYLRGNETQVRRVDNSWAPIYASAFNTQSVRRAKENFCTISDKEARKLLGFIPVHFDYINGEKAQSGFIAEDIEPVYPEICSYSKNEETGEKELFGLDYSKFVPYIVALLQVQQQEIAELKAAVSGISDSTGMTRRSVLNGPPVAAGPGSDGTEMMPAGVRMEEGNSGTGTGRTVSEAAPASLVLAENGDVDMDIEWIDKTLAQAPGGCGSERRG